MALKKVLNVNAVVLVFVGYLIYGTVKQNYTHLRVWMIINITLVAIINTTVFGVCILGLVMVSLEFNRNALGGSALVLVCVLLGAIDAIFTIVHGIF